MSSPDIKSRPQRIELDYFQRPDPYLRLRWRLACLALILAGGYVFYAAIWGAASHLNTGPLSAAHAHLERQCAECHEHAWPVSLASDAWRISPQRSLEHLEATCQRCHSVANHFRESLNEASQSIDRNCSGCHHEHLGREHPLTSVGDKMCVTCHADLPSRMVTASGLRPDIQAFNRESHGEFRSLAKDPGRVRFNHIQHLQPGQVAVNVRGGSRLDRLPERWRSVYQKPGQAPDAAVTLECEDCHQLPGRADETLASADLEVTGQHFLPIQFSQHCEGCHSLNYAQQTEDVLPLPHAAPWAEFQSILAAKLAAGKWRANDHETPAPTDSTLGPRPGQLRSPAGLIDASTLDQALRMVQRQCLKCHLADDITEQAIERLVGQRSIPLIPTRWFKYGRFDHAAHREVECESCHPVTRDTASNRADNEIVMIRGIDSCTPCHRSASTATDSAPPAGEGSGPTGTDARASARCVLCHRYHWTRSVAANQTGVSEEE